MEKTNIQRLSGVMLPFVIMVILQRLIGIVLAQTALDEVLCSLLAFLTASAGGIFFFRMSCGTDALRLQQGSLSEDGKEAYEAEGHIPPFPERDTVFGQILYVLACFGGLIVMMYIVTAMADAETIEPISKNRAAEFVSLVIIHPILEEYIFRWLYYRELRPMHPIFAGMAQSVMFAIVHGTVGGMIYAIFAGILLVFVMENSGSFAVLVSSHMLVNLRSFLFLTCLADGSGLSNAAHVRTVVDFCAVSLGFAAMLLLMVRKGLRDVWGAVDMEGENNDRN